MYAIDNELYHHGVKGMKWGVRRYRNYDGSYTKRGLERYGKAESRYDKNKSAYDKAKLDYKAGKVDKSTVKRAKSDMKMAKRRMSDAYDSLKLDKKADQGKNLYRSGKTITGNDYVTKSLGSVSGTLGTIAAYLHTNPQMAAQLLNTDVKTINNARNVAAAASITLGAAATAKYAKDHYEAVRLRAYYAGGGKYRED